jgi:hypothetical protein
MNLIDKNSIQFGRYDHFKGMQYELVDVVYHSETQEALVLYRALYGERQLWVRPFEMFFETIEREGKSLPRFCYVGD